MDEERRPLIGRGNLERGRLAGDVAVVTGAGGGCGFEAARALVWLGADVVIAEVDGAKGEAAMRRINEEAEAWGAGSGRAVFIQTDVGDEASVASLAAKTERLFGRIDCVFNNATVTPLGPVRDVPVGDWDRSYAVNLRGPVLLARAFLPGMIERDHGVFVCVPSSGAAPFLGPYEVFKTAQVELANTLAAELENTEVIAFSVGPGVTLTETAKAGFERLAPLYGLSIEEFAALSAEHLLPVEAAGAGFAAAVAMAGRYRGQEIGSIQALLDAGIDVARPPQATPAAEAAGTPPVTPRDPAAGAPGEAGARTPLAPEGASQAAAADPLAACRLVRSTLEEQVAGWAKRSLFERQWVIRDFRRWPGCRPSSGSTPCGPWNGD